MWWRRKEFRIIDTFCILLPKYKLQQHTFDSFTDCFKIWQFFFFFAEAAVGRWLAFQTLVKEYGCNTMLWHWHQTVSQVDGRQPSRSRHSRPQPPARLSAHPDLCGTPPHGESHAWPGCTQLAEAVIYQRWWSDLINVISALFALSLKSNIGSNLHPGLHLSLHARFRFDTVGYFLSLMQANKESFQTTISPVGTGCSRPRSPPGRRWRRRGAGGTCPGAGLCWGGNRPPWSSRSGPVMLQLRLWGGRGTFVTAWPTSFINKLAVYTDIYLQEELIL